LTQSSFDIYKIVVVYLVCVFIALWQYS
jgi:hypothetical protein